MTRFVGIVSGKGGVGKTTVAINLSIALRKLGKEVILLDGSLTTPDVGLNFGITQAPLTIHHILKNKKSLMEAAYQHESGVIFIPGDASLKALPLAHTKKFKAALKSLQGKSEFVIVDFPSGLEPEKLSLLDGMDELIIVTNPEIPAITHALKTISLADEKNITVLGVVLNRVKGNSFEIHEKNVEALLGKSLLVVLPEHEDISKAQKERQPLVWTYPNSVLVPQYTQLAKMISV